MAKDQDDPRKPTDREVLENIADTILPFWTINEIKYVKLEAAVAMRQQAKDQIK